MGGQTGKDDHEAPRRGKRGWRGAVAKLVLGTAGAAAVSKFTGTLSYRWLAGGLAVAGVAFAAEWVRGLDTRAWLPRYASWLFLVPAAAAAIAAAFVSGTSAGVLTAVAVILTAGAVLLTTGFEPAAWLLGGAAVIGAGVALIGAGAAVLADGEVLGGAAAIGAGVAGIWARRGAHWPGYDRVWYSPTGRRSHESASPRT